ncbi:hypothetical protein C8J56DRAFT_919664 [Mycena floridula]|nr:hypothetical protein C8J56DRAFT_919664 [Mycena floridula]
MRFISVSVLALCASIVSAHFQLKYPDPRGAFNEDDEVGLCDGYKDVATNRTEFPLTGGSFSLNSEHDQWVVGAFLANKTNPTSFDDFKQISPFFSKSGEGVFCLPLDFTSPNATGLTAGSNVTIQFVFNGGDGNLYQCSDVTLASNFTIPSSVGCGNTTGDNSTTGGGSTGGAQETLKLGRFATAMGLIIVAVSLL